PQNYAEALWWYRLGSNSKRSDNAMLELGKMYDNGEGMDPDKTRAYVLLSCVERHARKPDVIATARQHRQADERELPSHQIAAAKQALSRSIECYNEPKSSW